MESQTQKIIGSADAHFVIGKRHFLQNKPCQDHALHESFGDVHCIVISDGCSSGRHTDIGARIITCSVMKIIKEIVNEPYDVRTLPQIIHQRLKHASRISREMLDCINDDMLATCVYAVITPKGGFIHMLGDGCAGLQFTDGSLRLYQTTWQHNMPYYVADTREQAFIQEHVARQLPEDPYPLTIHHHAITETVIETHTTGKLGINDAITGYLIPLSLEKLLSIQSIFITSDGIQDFKTSGGILENPLEVMKQLSMVKVWNGEFIKRRLSRTLLNYTKQDIHPYDDISVAAIHIDHSLNQLIS